MVAAPLVTLALAASGCAEIDDSGSTTSSSTSQASQSEKSTSKDKSASTKKKEPELTSSQKNALRSAEQYVELAGISKKGLIQQLSSSAGEDYSKADAKFAANNVDVDYKAEAVEAAKAYLEQSPMSKSALIQQLSSSAGENFTDAQARYAADKAY